MKAIKIIIFLAAITLISCSKNEEVKTVKYMVTNSLSGFNVSYSKEDGSVVTEHITTASPSDKKNLYSFTAKSGDVFYISVTDTATYSFPQVYVFVDNKVFKQNARTDNKMMPVVVSGTIPF